MHPSTLLAALAKSIRAMAPNISASTGPKSDITAPPSADLHVHTPLVPSARLSELAGAPVMLKLECAQPSGSFKMRGHSHFLRLAAARGVTHVVSSSGGNAGAAVAAAGAALKLRVTIVVPSTTPKFMQKRLTAAGATVEIAGSVWDESDKRAREIADADEDAVHVSPFDHPDIWAGIASLPRELDQDLAGLRPSAIALSVGGGGLFCGVAQGMQELGWDSVPIVAAETEGAGSFAAMVEAGEVVDIGQITSIAKSLGACKVTEKCAEWVQSGRPVSSVTVTDREAVEACSLLATEHRLLVEPACGAAVAVVCQKGVVERMGDGPVVVVVCGGNMASPELLEEWIEATGATRTVL